MLTEKKKLPKYSVYIVVPTSRTMYGASAMEEFLEFDKIFDETELWGDGGSGFGETDVSIHTPNWEKTLQKLYMQIKKKKIKNANYIVYKNLENKEREEIKTGNF